MINVDLLWYLLVPLALSTATFIVLRKYVEDLDRLQAAGAALTGLLISAAMMGGAFYFGKGMKTGDTEILNGEVLAKSREHDTYVESYSCNCHQVCSGTGKSRSCHQVCSTCYRHHYTVTWSCDTNIGEFRIDHRDSLSRSVYNTPDPGRYTVIEKGDPVARKHDYTNYIKAVPESLFRPAPADLKKRFEGKIPAYPLDIYDLYHVDRVLPVGVKVPNLREWNDQLSEVLKKLGPKRQANAVIVLTDSADPQYFYALQDAWLGGKKNDIVLVIGAPDFPAAAEWVRVMALTKDQIFQVKLRDRVLALPELTAETVIGALEEEAYATFHRKEMANFAYLDNDGRLAADLSIADGFDERDDLAQPEQQQADHGMRLWVLQEEVRCRVLNLARGADSSSGCRHQAGGESAGKSRGGFRMCRRCLAPRHRPASSRQSDREFAAQKKTGQQSAGRREAVACIQRTWRGRISVSLVPP